MARLFTSGFEASDLGIGASSVVDGIDGHGFNAAAITSSPVRSGNFALSLSLNLDASVGIDYTAPALGTDLFLRAYVQVTSMASVRYLFMSLGQAFVALDTSGNAWLTTDGTTSIGSQVPFSLNTWHMVELRQRIATGALDQVEWRLDGVSMGLATGLSLTDTPPNAGGLGEATTSAVGQYYFDDVALNDSTGASQNSWPGEGKVVLLLPTGDSAKGTGWTNDAAGASNFFDAVNNTPPVGIADTTASTGLHQIRNATSNANSSYDATMQSYVAAGVPNGSAISVIDPIVVTGAPVTTSSKQGTVGVASNPAIANVALGAGGSSGAFWAGSAANTYPVAPAGWKISHGTATYGAAPTLATAPVMRITQVTSSTRIAMVCFMGIYVDFSPPSLAAPLMINQSVQRVATR